MNTSTPKVASTHLTISYETIRDLALFQEQYDRLTDEIQQVRVQLESSPPLAPSALDYEKREEWRSWLQLQIKSKQKARESMVANMQERNITIDNLPD
jgi:hypothetical protein